MTTPTDPRALTAMIPYEVFFGPLGYEINELFIYVAWAWIAGEHAAGWVRARRERSLR